MALADDGTLAPLSGAAGGKPPDTVCTFECSGVKWSQQTTRPATILCRECSRVGYDTGYGRLRRMTGLRAFRASRQRPSGRVLAGACACLAATMAAATSGSAATGARRLSPAPRDARATAATRALSKVLPAAVAPAQRTAVTVYRAFSPAGKPLLSIARAVSGSCFGPSEAANRDDAWRCSTASKIYDPCFSSRAAPTFVLCPATPQARSATLLTLTQALPTSAGHAAAPSTASEPWWLQLDDGMSCEFAEGATFVVGGDRLDYVCSARAQTGLWGYPDRSREPWTILMAPFHATQLTHRVRIAHAWT